MYDVLRNFFIEFHIICQNECKKRREKCSTDRFTRGRIMVGDLLIAKILVIFLISRELCKDNTMVLYTIIKILNCQ